MSVCKVIAGSLTEWEGEGTGREGKGGRMESDGSQKTSTVRGETERKKKRSQTRKNSGIKTWRGEEGGKSGERKGRVAQ